MAALVFASSLLPLLLAAADAPPPVRGPVPDQNPRSETPRPDVRMTLDSQQRQAFQEALRQHRPNLARLDGQLRAAMTELVKASLADAYDEKSAREKGDRMAKIQAEIILLRCQALAAVVPTLRPEQRAELLTGRAGTMLVADTLTEFGGAGPDRNNPGGQPPRGPQPPADPVADALFPPELVMRFQAQISLTDEQRQAIMSDLQEAQPKFESLHQQVDRERNALAALLKKERVDLDPALAQSDKLLDLEREMRRLQLTLQVSLKNRLTPEQQATLQRLRQQAGPDLAGAGGQPQAIRAKMEQLQAGLQQWQQDGRDSSPIGAAMRKFGPLMQAGKFEEAERVLDEALQTLQEGKRPR
jgi:Spy/CpxP family protein refolding chaperone